MGLFGSIGGLLGGGSQKKAIKKATKQQVKFLNRAIDEQKRQYDTTRADFQPYRDEGYAGLDQLGDLVGTHGGDKQAAAIEALRASPFYQSLYRNGEEAVLQNASATGGLRGGDTERGLADFGADTLMQTIERQLSSLGGLAGMGMGATESVANFGANKANAVSGLLGQIGSAKAAGTIARGNITSQMWQNAGGMLDSAISAAIGAGAGPGGSSFNLGSFFGGF
jgi:hypothetical protein